MFNGYNDTPLTSYEFSQERGDKKPENAGKWTYGHNVAAQAAQAGNQEFWSGKTNFLGIPNVVKCNCTGCYPPPEKQSYQGESTRHRPWLPRTFPVPVNGSNEQPKLPAYQWNSGQSCYTDVTNLSYENCEKYSYYKHYQRLAEPNQPGVITSVKNAELERKPKNPGGEESPLPNGTKQPVYCNPGYGLSKRMEGRNYPAEKYSGMTTFPVDEHIARPPVVEPFTKAVPSNLSQNRVPSTGYRSVKENMPQTYVELSYGSGMNGDYMPVAEQQKLYFDNTRHDFYPRVNYQDVMKRNSQTLESRKDCYVNQMSEMIEYNVPRSKYQCVSDGGDAFYQKDVEKPRLEGYFPENSTCIQRPDDTKVENPNFQTRLHSSAMLFNDRTQNPLSYQNNPIAYRNYLGREFPCQGYNSQRYEYPGTVQRNDLNQYRPIQQQPALQQGNNLEENFRGKSENSSYLESIRSDGKNGTNKISPLRLLRKKKFTNLPPPQETVPVSTLDSVPGLDVRKFWSTWADEEEENVAPTQMVVLDCQNIDPEQAKLLHLYETDSVRPVQVESSGSVEETQSGGVKESVSETKMIKETDSRVEIVQNDGKTEEGSQSPVPEPKPIESVCQKLSKPKELRTETEKKKSDGMDKWTEKKFDFLKRAEESKAAEILRQEKEKKKIFQTRLSLQQSFKKVDKLLEKNKEEETPSPFDENSQNSPPGMGVTNLPTSEYRRNKFLDYSDGKLIIGEDKDPLEEMKNGDVSLKEESGLNDLLERMSAVNCQPEHTTGKKPKKPKRKKEEKQDDDRTDKLTVETVTKPTIKFSIQKSHDLKISFKVLNSSNSDAGGEEVKDEGKISNEDTKNSTELITLKYKSIQREGGSQESKKNRRRKKSPKAPVLKIKKSRYMPEEEEKDPLGDDDDDVSDKRSDGFQVEERMDSAKIKLTFKRHKRNVETEYKINREKSENLSEVELTPEDETEGDRTKKRSKKKKKEEIFAEAGVDCFGNYLERSDAESCFDEIKPNLETEDSRNSSISSFEDKKSSFDVLTFGNKISDEKPVVFEESGHPDDLEKEGINCSKPVEFSFDYEVHCLDKPGGQTFSNKTESGKEEKEVQETSSGFITCGNLDETNEERGRDSNERSPDEIRSSETPLSSYELKSEKGDGDDTSCALQNMEVCANVANDAVDVVSSMTEKVPNNSSLDLSCGRSLERAAEEPYGTQTVEGTNSEGLLTLVKTIDEVNSPFEGGNDLMTFEKNLSTPKTTEEFQILPNFPEKTSEMKCDMENAGRSDLEILLKESENTENEFLEKPGDATPETFLNKFSKNSPKESALVDSQSSEHSETAHMPLLEVHTEVENSKKSTEDTNADPEQQKRGTEDVDGTIEINSEKRRTEAVESSKGDDSGCAECSFSTDEVTPWEDDIELEDGEIVDSCDEEGAQPVVVFPNKRMKCDFVARRIQRRHSENESHAQEPKRRFSRGKSCPPAFQVSQKEAEHIQVEDIPLPAGPPPIENCFFLIKTSRSFSTLPPVNGDSFSRTNDQHFNIENSKPSAFLSGIFHRNSKIKFSFLKRSKFSKVNFQTQKNSNMEVPETKDKEGTAQPEPERILEGTKTEEVMKEPSAEEGSKQEETGAHCEDLESVVRIDSVHNFTQNEFYECEDIPTSEDLTIGDDLENEKVNDDKFRNIMQNCLDNAKKFLNVGNLKLFSCSVDDLLELDCQTSPREETGDTNHISRDVLLTSCEDPNDDMDLSENIQSNDISMDFVPSFCSDVCPEILPVDNWPYLEEEVPSSPSKTKSDETDLVPTLEGASERNPKSGIVGQKLKRFRRKSLITTSSLEEGTRCSKVGAQRRKTIGSITYGRNIQDMRNELIAWKEEGKDQKEGLKLEKIGSKREIHFEREKKSLDYKSPTWQPKVMLIRISKNELRKVLKTSKTHRRFKSESSPRRKDSSAFESGVVCEVKEQKLYVRSVQEPAQCKEMEDNRRKEISIDLSKLESIKGSLKTTNPELRKRKKSRFRNLHTKKRVEPDTDKDVDFTNRSALTMEPGLMDAETAFAKMFGNSDDLSDPCAAISKAISEDEPKKIKTVSSKIESKSENGEMKPQTQDENKNREKRHEHRDRRREKSEGRHKERSRESESRKNGKRGHDRGKHGEKRSSSGRRRFEGESDREGAGDKKWKGGLLSPEGPWVCEVCGFNDASDRVVHIKNHPFHCQSCHLAFKTETHFIGHLTKKHKDIRNQHHCLLCELSFDTEDEYQRHLETREHRHLESVEKNTINTLFTLLTGAPCPVFGVLEMKPEWLPNQAGTVHFYHQATPLSLALQYLKMHHDLTSFSTSAHPN